MTNVRHLHSESVWLIGPVERHRYQNILFGNVTAASDKSPVTLPVAGGGVTGRWLLIHRATRPSQSQRVLLMQPGMAPPLRERNYEPGRMGSSRPFPLNFPTSPLSPCSFPAWSQSLLTAGHPRAPPPPLLQEPVCPPHPLTAGHRKM